MLYQDRTFENETLELDGNDYVRCRFRGCTMIYRASGPGFTLTDSILGDTAFQYEDAAKVVINLHTQVTTMAISQAPETALLRVGKTWFKRIPRPTNVGTEAENTDGFGMVIPA